MVVPEPYGLAAASASAFFAEGESAGAVRRNVRTMASAPASPFGSPRRHSSRIPAAARNVDLLDANGQSESHGHILRSAGHDHQPFLLPD
jgi:hypothetical protein